MAVIRNPRRAGPRPNNNRPSGAAPIADSRRPDDLFAALAHGNRATRRLAARNLRKSLKGQR